MDIHLHSPRKAHIPLQASVRACVYHEREAESQNGVAILYCPEALASNLRLAREKKSALSILNDKTQMPVFKMKVLARIPPRFLHGPALGRRREDEKLSFRFAPSAFS